MPSRRAFLATATATTSLLAGCTGHGVSGIDPSPTDTEPAFVARLDGPAATRHLFDGADVATVGDVQDARGAYALPVTLTDDATGSVRETFDEAGVPDDPDAFEVVLRFEGEATGRFAISPGFAEEIDGGEWDGAFRLTFQNEQQAHDVRQALTDGG
jgi:hypothetical protein